MRNRRNPETIRQLEVENRERETLGEALAQAASLVAWPRGGVLLNSNNGFLNLHLKIKAQTSRPMLVE